MKKQPVVNEAPIQAEDRRANIADTAPKVIASGQRNIKTGNLPAMVRRMLKNS